MPDRLTTRTKRHPARATVAPRPPVRDGKVAASIAPTGASATNPNRAKRKLAKRPNTPRTSVKRDGLTRSGVTVIRVDPATLRRSTAGGRNTSKRVIDGGTVVARNVLSRRGIRKNAVSA